MAKKLDKTLADYVVGGVMPALLIGLLVSLCFFLLELAMTGQNVGQLKWVLFFFIVGTVLIARIAMRGDIAERAGVYGIALAIAAGLALVRFVEIPQTALGGFGWLIPISLMCVIWWSAHKLTLDSTWDEEAEPEETSGLFDATPEPERPRDDKKDWYGRYEADRLAEAQKKKPGLMMVYFSLAALPLFGVGQAMLPAADLERRRYAFWLLTLYVACGLGLLLTTSFLGLRRYLRGRRLQMPAAMTGLWLGLGSALIVTLMVLSAYFLPRPEAEYHFSQLLGWAGSKERDANRWHMFEGSTGRNNEGASGVGRQEKQQQAQGNNRWDRGNPSQQGRQAEGRADQKMAGGQRGDPTRGNRDQGGPGRQQQGDKGEPADGGRGSQGKNGQGKQGSQASSKSGQQGQGGAGGNQKTGEKQPGQNGEQNKEGQGGGQTKDKEGDKGNQQQGEGAQGDNSPDKPQKDRQNPPEAGEQEKKNQDREGERQGQNDKEQQDQGSGNSPPPPPRQQEASQWSWDWLKWIVYGLIVAGIIFGLWKYGRQLWNAILQMWMEFLAWWYGLFKGKQEADVDEAIGDAEANLPPQPFAWFSNPLLSPNRFKSMEEMIRYSFGALHSWGYEQGLGRQPFETPTEFAQRLGQHRDKAYPEIRKLTDLYAVVTYARVKAPASSEAILRSFWNRLYEEQPRQLVVN